MMAARPSLRKLARQCVLPQKPCAASVFNVEQLSATRVGSGTAAVVEIFCSRRGHAIEANVRWLRVRSQSHPERLPRLAALVSRFTPERRCSMRGFSAMACARNFSPRCNNIQFCCVRQLLSPRFDMASEVGRLKTRPLVISTPGVTPNFLICWAILPQWFR